MNNSAFDIAVRNRLLLDCLDDNEEAVFRACRACRKRDSYNGSHVRCGCRKMALQGTRQPIRNKQHTEVQEALKVRIIIRHSLVKWRTRRRKPSVTSGDAKDSILLTIDEQEWLCLQ